MWQVLTEVQSNGSALLLNVNDVYAACVSFGLIPGPIARTVVSGHHRTSAIN